MMVLLLFWLDTFASTVPSITATINIANIANTATAIFHVTTNASVFTVVVSAAVFAAYVVSTNTMILFSLLLLLLYHLRCRFLYR